MMNFSSPLTLLACVGLSTLFYANRGRLEAWVGWTRARPAELEGEATRRTKRLLATARRLATQPPSGQQGVKVLGTLAWEHGDGALAARLILEAADEGTPSSPPSDSSFVHGSTYSSTGVVRRTRWRDAVEGWVAEAADAGVDGYLLNVEVPVPADQVTSLKSCVAYLRSRAAAVLGDDAEVVWYDAVTIGGTLAWQNELTPHNADFFAVADSIYLNYSWTPRQVQQSVEAAGDRATDVLVGVDVWGRAGQYGGGGFDTDKAVRVAREAGASVAIFAPGWTDEAFSTPAERAAAHQRLWCDRLAPVLPEAPTALGLPFATDFCEGQGEAMFLAGRRVVDGLWHNYGWYSVQPAVLPARVGVARVEDERTIVFSGSRSLRVAATLAPGETADVTVLRCARWTFLGGLSVAMPLASDTPEAVQLLLHPSCDEEQPIVLDVRTGATSAYHVPGAEFPWTVYHFDGVAADHFHKKAHYCDITRVSLRLRGPPTCDNRPSEVHAYLGGLSVARAPGRLRATSTGAPGTASTGLRQLRTTRSNEGTVHVRATHDEAGSPWRRFLLDTNGVPTNVAWQPDFEWQRDEPGRANLTLRSFSLLSWTQDEPVHATIL